MLFKLLHGSSFTVKLKDLIKVNHGVYKRFSSTGEKAKDDGRWIISM